MRNLGIDTAVVVGLIVGACVGAAPAATVIVGDHDLQPETPNQTITIDVSGGDNTWSLSFFAQIASGSATGTPMFEDPGGVDIITGTIFAGDNIGQQSDTYTNQLWYCWTQVQDPPSNPVTASGLLVTLSIDTTGAAPGTYDLLLSGTLWGDTELLDQSADPISLTITNGTITVVPEPATLGLMGLGGAGLLVRLRRRTPKRLTDDSRAIA